MKALILFSMHLSKNVEEHSNWYKKESIGPGFNSILCTVLEDEECWGKAMIAPGTEDGFFNCLNGIARMNAYNNSIEYFYRDLIIQGRDVASSHKMSDLKKSKDEIAQHLRSEIARLK